MTASTTPPAHPGPAAGQPTPGAPGGPSQPLPPTTVAQPGKPPKPSKEEKRGKRWTMAERLLAVLAAALSVVAGGLGIWGSNAASERDDLETTTDSLVEERDAVQDQRDQLDADLADAQATIDDLEKASATTVPETTLATSPDGSTAPPLPGEPAFLNQLDPVAGDVSTDEAELGGQRYRNLVRIDLADCDYDSLVEYNLGAGYDTFTAQMGPTDTVEDSSDTWRFVITTIDANGEHILLEKEMKVAQVEEVSVPVAGAQRLRLSVEDVDVDTETSRCSYEDNAAVWADPKLT
jgi:hypothetical protein